MEVALYANVALYFITRVYAWFDIRKYNVDLDFKVHKWYDNAGKIHNCASLIYINAFRLLTTNAKIVH